MARELERPDRDREDYLHPILYRVIVGLAAWLALSVWGFFGTSGYTDFLLAVVTGFVLVSVIIPAALWRIWRRDRHDAKQSESGGRSFHDWLLGEFDVWQTHLKGTDAADAILLPWAAVAIGMTIFAIVKYLAVGG